jgi:ArsR family transcriptional regulator
LRDAGLVIGVKRGYYTHYSLDKEALGQVIAVLEQLRSAESAPCHRPFYGCEEAEYLQCKAYVPPEKRGET